MNGKVIGGIAFVAIILFACVWGYFDYANKGVDWEEDIKAQYKSTQESLSTYTTKVREAAQVPNKYQNDLKELMTAALSSRYGDQGSRATMQWISEQNSNLDPDMYKQITRIIEAGRDKYSAKQNALISLTTSYQKALKKPWSKQWLAANDFPSEGWNFDDFKILINESVLEQYKEGKLKEIEVF